MDHAAFRELAAGAVLEDLDPAELQHLDRHLAGCPACAAVAEQLHDVVWDLALLTPEIAPPAGLQASVIDAVRASAFEEPVRIHAERASQPDIAAPSGPRRRGWQTLAPLALAAVFGIVAVGLGVRVGQLTQQNSAAVAAAADAQAQVAARDGAMAVLASPDHRTASLAPEALAPDATAVAVFEPGTTRSYVMVAHLPATPAGHVYQLWYADSSGVHALGTYRHDGTTAFVAPFGVDLSTSDAAMITLEPDGGTVDGAPGPQVVFGTL